MNKTDKSEVRDSTGNILSPGMYGYETVLARRDAEHLAKQRASDKIKAVTDPRTVARDTRSVLEQAQRALASVQGKARTMQIVLAYCRVCNALKG